jgi:uncharacterized protein with PIN domain
MSIKVKNKKPKKLEKEFAKKINMFGRLEDSCLVCEKPFDKKDREMVMSWYVVVREEEKKVNLYCPSCWGAAMKAIEEVKGNDSGNC